MAERWKNEPLSLTQSEQHKVPTPQGLSPLRCRGERELYFWAVFPGAALVPRLPRAITFRPVGAGVFSLGRGGTRPYLCVLSFFWVAVVMKAAMGPFLAEIRSSLHKYRPLVTITR